MNTDLNYIRANILNYEISFSVLSWAIQEIGGDFSMMISKDIALELINLIEIEGAKKYAEDDEQANLEASYERGE